MNSKRTIKTDYLTEEPALRRFYHYSPIEPDFQQIASDKAEDNTDRGVLATVIRSQYEGLELGKAVEDSLARLAQPDSFTITTGHQLVLFGGPMFTTYKVLTVIKLAKQLQEQGINVVPVFWIHGEDHDFEEINHFYQDFHQKVSYQGTFHTEVGSHILDQSIEELRPASLPDSLTQLYAEGIAMKDAYRAFFHELFKDYGLLMLDATDHRLKAVFAEVMKEELTKQIAHEAVSDTSQQMDAAGYSQQINAREVNLFYLDEKGRNRIVQTGDHFEIVDRELVFTQEEILEVLVKSPERFSPNVSMRPLYQEMILPNLAYVGGWGELSYWLQLRGLFDKVGVNYPLLLPRMSATLFTDTVAEEWMSLGFSLEEIKEPLHLLNAKYLPKVWDTSSFEAYEQKILKLLDEMKEYVQEDVSETLARSSDALTTKTRKYLENLQKKAGKIKRQQHHAPFTRIKTLKEKVEPPRMVQERILSLASFGSEVKPDELIPFLYQACTPLRLEHQCLILPKSNDFGNG